MNTEKKRMSQALKVICNKKLKISIPNNLISYLEKFNFETPNLNPYIDDINEDDLKLRNNIISNNRFISNEIKDSISQLNSIIKYKNKQHEIFIFGNSIDKQVLNNIISILNLFDSITNNNNYYKIYIFLTNNKKDLDNTTDTIGPNSINSGSTIPNDNITLWRKEELYKVLIHELIHYLQLDIYELNNDLKIIYNNINLIGNTNPNEAYTEFLALIYFTYWKFYISNTNLGLKKFMSNRLTIEYGWSLLQVAKIINYFSCSNYQDLFNQKCTFKQNTNVISYFLLKTYFLFNFQYMIENIENISLNTLIQSIDLTNDTFTNLINYCLSLTFSSSMRMSALD